jgi:hypothetical protein
MKMRLGCLSVVMLVGACTSPQGDGAQPAAPSDPPYQLQPPSLTAVGPGQLSLGDTVKLVGQGFIDPDHGEVLLRMGGSYTTVDGRTQRYQGEFPLTRRSASTADFEFGPTIPFFPTGDVLGTFHGQAVTVNRMGHGDPQADEASSDPIDVDLQVMPSILVQQLHSVDAACQAVTSATVAETNLGIGLRALGVSPGTASAPLKFRVHVPSPAMNVTYVRNDWYAQWPIQPTVFASAPAGLSGFAVSVTDGDSVYIDPRTRQQVVDLDSPVLIGQQSYSQVKLAQLMTGKLDGQGKSTLTMTVDAETTDGSVLHRVVHLDVYKPQEILPYDGNTKVVERYAANPVSSCFPGGQLGADLEYSESQTDTRARSLTFNWDIANSASVGFNVSAEPFGVGVGANTSATWTQTFGVEVDQTVSSEMSAGRNLTVHIVPTFFGVCYRQTERLEHTVGLVYHNACGASAQVGQAVLTDWNWSFDIATGRACPPPTNLPPAQVF